MSLSFIASFALLAHFALATPVEPTRQAESVVGVYYTTDKNWGNGHTTGDRYHDTIETLSCRHLAPPFVDSISSFGPDSGVKCTVFDTPLCISNGSSLEIWNEGYADMSWNGWDNRIRSFLCVTCIPDVDAGCR
ncbi:hypothetical protein K504DRAFT_534084 [Pleomassaria siparia CBS 279.74]|uniref:Uncharacterized protein n=1 Tax=Pleomassaria siparia CBS 279.74 TaxID=1314801 RepID=A0A6G1KA45_9PLEO|nr:hypothetical protein K504DRAFT_534084 [Pleomassaria siparia CBS 279.74]